MAEYFGDGHVVALQESLRARLEEFARTPKMSNGGRIANIHDIDAFGWDRIRDMALRDGFLGLTMVDRDGTLAKLAEIFGPGASFAYWDAFTGAAAQVIPACEAVIAATPLPAGWRLESLTHPDDATIDMFQRLNQATGVAPTPAYFMRGDYVPSVLTCLFDADGALAAGANATMRYHPDGPLAGWLFAGAVSVDPVHRRMGLGALVNAALLQASHAAHGWTHVLEQAKADNPASCGMIARCGLRGRDGLVTIVINTSGAYLTR